ncbi:MAG: hypothetical protein ACJ75Z_12170 [Solirubrobacterales bacterium]
MRAGKPLAVLAIAAIALGALAATAFAAQKKKTTVIFFAQNPNFNKNGKVSAKGSLNTANACESGRSVRLQVLDVNGVVITTLDGSTTDSGGNWSMSGQIPNSLRNPTNAVRVKAKKKTVGKFVCQAGVSPNVPIPAPVP